MVITTTLVAVAAMLAVTLLWSRARPPAPLPVPVQRSRPLLRRR